jgi:DNA polymerase elongation subunit (family B)
MRQVFLCQPGYDDIIRCGREIISDRGIFVDKKRYILHVVDSEGTPSDKLKVMGLDTKKTTMPKIVSTKLNKFIERLLKGDTWDNMANDIVEYKEYLLQNEDVRIIGLPKGIKGIEEYTKKYEEAEKQAKKHREKNNCSLPGHIAAAICYNKCLDTFNDKASLRITSGMKIKVFYLTHMIFDRFTSIALPTDIEVIPDWFYSKCEIDKEKHIARLVDNPLRNIIKAINKIPPNKQERVFTSIIGDDVSFESMRTTQVKKEKVSNEAQNTAAETIFGVVLQEEDPKQVPPVVDDTAAQKNKQNKLADDIFGL